MKYNKGDRVILDGPLYYNSQTHNGISRTGQWYIYDGELINGRYRVTNLVSRIGQWPRQVNVSGYVSENDIKPAE